jgi:hypothetical protein
MKMWKSSGSLAVLFVFVLNAHLPLRSQVPATETPPKRSAAATTAAGDSPIRFVFQPIDFRLDSSETPERHAPETMAGGAAIFDFNNDGKLDIFFANGADIKTLHKTSAKYYNRTWTTGPRCRT